jgi:hypothetical protein
MGMQDKRILSYLLVDHLRPDHEKRIEALDSRYVAMIFGSLFSNLFGF